MAFTLTSPAITDGQPVPREYTCDGRGISPALRWSDPPAGTREFALILDDPDAPSGVFTHWLLYGLQPGTTEIPENVASGNDGPNGSKQGKNSAGRVGYMGPCPPPGHGTHRYVFNLYALDAPLNLRAGESKANLLAAMNGHVIALTQLTGTYERRPPDVERLSR